uniref:Zinc knuckle CX2CX4HX4C domain-containing protein n=1 Tax=Cannabis sativa TaxID=3483 RepID=A0A803Q028_CANSA
MHSHLGKEKLFISLVWLDPLFVPLSIACFAEFTLKKDIILSNFTISLPLNGRFDVSLSIYESDSYLVTFGCEGDLRRVLSKEPWHFHNQHMILCLPSVLQNASMESYTITPFWVQVFRLPFLSKTASLARTLGNLIGTFIEVFEDSLNEGWGLFLRIRVGIDVSKPLLRGQMVTFPWMADDLWLDYRYERLPDFCYECGIVGHVFDKCALFMEKIDEGKEPDLSYGPWMEGSALPKSAYDRYRQDFSKAGPWPFITRLVRNTVAPIIPPCVSLPTIPHHISNHEKGKAISESSTDGSLPQNFLNMVDGSGPSTVRSPLPPSCHENVKIFDPSDDSGKTDKHCNAETITKTFKASLSAPVDLSKKNGSATSHVSPKRSVVLSMDTPPAYAHITPSLNIATAKTSMQNEHLSSDLPITAPSSGLVNITSNNSDSTLAHDVYGNENRLSSLFSKRQLVTSSGNMRTVLKRCRTNASPLADATNSQMHDQLVSPSDFSSLSLEADGANAFLARADVQPRQSP